jgi:hypothetical protein
MTEDARKIMDGLIEALAGPARGQRPEVDTLTRQELERLLNRLRRQADQETANRETARIPALAPENRAADGTC